MNRDIKFRGIRKYNGDVVFGDLIHGVGWAKGCLFILPNVTNLASIPGCHPLDGCEIIPETSGQFTGFCDKNGVEIYEGDCDAVGNVVEFSYGSWNLNGDRPLSLMLNVFEVSGNIHQK